MASPVNDRSVRQSTSYSRLAPERMGAAEVQARRTVVGTTVAPDGTRTTTTKATPKPTPVPLNIRPKQSFGMISLVSLQPDQKAAVEEGKIGYFVASADLANAPLLVYI